MLSWRFGALLFVALLGACGPDDPDDPSGSGGSSSAGSAGSVGNAGASAGSGGSTAGSSNGAAGSSATGGSAGSNGAGGALTGQAWKDFMFKSYCPAACEKSMKLPCYTGGASTDCVNECYAFWTNAFMICPTAVPPLTQCGYPDKVSYACADGMVSESFGADCDDEASAVSNCN